MYDNKCGAGYCAKGYTSQEVKECQADLGINWNGQCGYQSGQRVEDTQQVVRLNCCRSGCEMSREQYAHWNGQCAYQEKELEQALDRALDQEPPQDVLERLQSLEI